MTIGIAAFGPNAGRAVAEGLRAAELLGRGSIGGFAVFSIFDAEGRHHQRCVQDGGISALDLPGDWGGARIAAVISSGPNRPEPLSQFLAADARLGLVTGHRLPSTPGRDGRALNLMALEDMAGLEALLAAHPEHDAGLIALAPDGTLRIGNTARVMRRGDLGQAQGAGAGYAYGLLCNSIFHDPSKTARLADPIAAIIAARLTGHDTGWRIAWMPDPVPILPAEADLVETDADHRITAIHSANPAATRDTNRLTVVQDNAPIASGGRAATELFARITGGLAHPLPGLPRHLLIQTT